MDRKIIIIGKKDSGKTTLARKIGWKNFDGDDVRNEFQNFDFSIEGRIEQARTMGFLMSAFHGNSTASFICPTHSTLDEFLRMAPKDVKIIWMDTIQHEKIGDVVKVWETPARYDIRITDFNYTILDIMSKLYP